MVKIQHDHIPKLDDYRKIVGKDVIDKLRESSEHLRDKHIVHINATAVGGGVAEILNTLVFLMNDLGIDTGWRILLGSHSFFKITKGIHNSLQGGKWSMTSNRKHVYMEYCKRNSIINHISDHDIVVIHDPQPLGMIEDYELKTHWLWRCHIDISHPNPDTMKFLLPYIRKYNGVILSHPKFKIKNMKKPQVIIHPSIDPLSTKNKNITKSKAKQMLSKRGIDTDKPIISQISRFDPWKNHFGVIRMYEKLRKEHKDCQLVLMGDMAADDPQGPMIYHKVQQKTEKIPDIHIITEKNDLLVNALQRQSSVIFQNSIKEGFALTVSESLWKGTPVIGTSAGGIPLQVIDGKTGYIINNEKEGVKRALNLLNDHSLRNKLGKQGKEHVRKNFLITRHLQDYVDLFSRIYPPSRL
ncbi:glycosyltransferase [Candidatus Woesearchaeota archaeon]|nr:glycosyltransferase [Candidatus Woesearchaeota archaeon]